MKNLIIFIILSLFLTPTFSATAPSGGGGGWTNKTVTRLTLSEIADATASSQLSDVIEATARKQAVKNGTAVTLEAVVRETVNRQAVGKVLLKRLLAGGLLIGATQALVDGVGWVMEDGVYVKYKIPKNDPAKPPNSEYYWQTQIDTGPFYSEISSDVFNARAKQLCKEFSTCTSYSYKVNDSNVLAPNFTGLVGSKVSIILTFNGGSTNTYPMSQTSRNKNPNYKPDLPKPDPIKIVLTDELMGDLAVGDYTDPVDETKNKKDKVWTDVENSYQPDVTGNDLNDKINNKLDNAPETNNKPTTKPKPDGDGQKYPAPDEKPGGQGETENTTNPETGNQTGNFTLPDWCLWAADQCQWHKEEKEVWKEEKNQRDSEKSFWQKVTDWFDWTKEEPEKEEEPDRPEIDEKGIFSRTFDTVFSLSKQCPPDVPYTLETQYLKGNFTISLNWLCVIFTFLGYPLQLIAHLTGLWILYETVVRKEIKW